MMEEPSGIHCTRPKQKSSCTRLPLVYAGSQRDVGFGFEMGLPNWLSLDVGLILPPAPEKQMVWHSSFLIDNPGCLHIAPKMFGFRTIHSKCREQNMYQKMHLSHSFRNLLASCCFFNLLEYHLLFLKLSTFICPSKSSQPWEWTQMLPQVPLPSSSPKGPARLKPDSSQVETAVALPVEL